MEPSPEAAGLSHCGVNDLSVLIPRGERRPGTARVMREPVRDATMTAMGSLSRLRGIVIGRSGRLVAVVVLAVTGAAEARMYASEPSTGVLFNMIVVSQLVVVQRFPRVASLVATIATLVMLADRFAPLTVTGVISWLVIDMLLVMRGSVRLVLLFSSPLAVNALSPLDGSEPGAASFGPLILLVATVLVGEVLRQRGRAIEERDAARFAVVDSMREQAAMEERARIARELHDIVAHYLSMISVQTETARLTEPDLSDRGRERFEEIGRTARKALTEMRRLLGVLRNETGEPAEREPQPGLDQLSDLIDSARNTGSNVHLVLLGRAVEVPAGIDLTAYRILQEALTNVRRHAPGADVEIEVDYRPEALHLRISDTGCGHSEVRRTPGHGLMGMRDRIAMVGGALSYGPGIGGGFTVKAELPFEAVT